MDPKLLLPLIASNAVTAMDVGYMLTFCKIDRPLKTPFYLDNIHDEDCLDFFRFQREHLLLWREELRITDLIRTENGSVFSGMEELCALLRRLAYPNRLTDIKHIFSHLKLELLLVINWTLNRIYSQFGFLLTSLDLCWLQRYDFATFAAAIHAAGAPLRNCWAFIDVTVRPICRPSEDQRLMFNGHYRVHGFIMQSVVTANGLIVNLDGPWPGRRHDSSVLTDSGIIPALQAKMKEIDGNYVIYGDPAYPSTNVTETPFRRRAADLSQDQTTFNMDMSSVRVSVEWTFGKIVRYFAFADFTKNQKILLLPVGKYYSVAALFTNCHSCLYGSQNETFFNVHPPSVQQYLRNQLC